MAEIDVTVIIPTYNRLWSLPRAVESCRHTACITEIIVVDDGSDDGTWDWLQQQKDVRSFYQENQGQTYAVNYGTMYATGKYIRFLDSDDMLCEGAISKQFLKAVETDADLVYSDVDIYNDVTKEIISRPTLRPWDDFLEVQLGNSYGSHYLGMLFKTELVRKTPRRPDFTYRDDRMFLLEYCLLEPKIVWLKGCAGYWVKHPQQMQANYHGLKAQATNWQHLNIYKKILACLAATGKLSQKRKKAACTVLWPLAHWIAKNDISEGAEVVEWIYQLDPEFQIPERGVLRMMYKNLGFKATERLLRIRRSIISR